MSNRIFGEAYRGCLASVNWSSVQAYVLSQQKKIYKLSKCNTLQSKKAMEKIQCQLTQSIEARLLAIRIATQDNRGKRTVSARGLADRESRELLSKVLLDGCASPLKKIEILDRNGLKRFFAIPTLTDFIKQKLLTMALDPQWEAIFDSTIYGLRPGYGPWDAKWFISQCLFSVDYYILDACIEKNFDNVDSLRFLQKIDVPWQFEVQLRAWFKNGLLFGSDTGFKEIEMPRFISSLLINIALNGLGEVIEKVTGRRLFVEGSFPNSKGENLISIVRYGGSFLVFAKSLEDIKRIKQAIISFLKLFGLHLNLKKTRIRHSLKRLEDASYVGVHFLGFHFYQTLIWRRVRSFSGLFSKVKLKLWTRPTWDAVQEHLASIKRIVRIHRAAPQVVVITKLAPIIRDWTNYYAVTLCNKTFQYCTYRTFQLLWAWSRRKTKTVKQALSYWIRVGGDNWVFGYRVWEEKYKKWSVVCLRKHRQTSSRLLLGVQVNRSVYDSGPSEYWKNRDSLLTTAWN